MRTIKFRGKRAGNIWVYGSHVVDANSNHYILSTLSDKSGDKFWNSKFQNNEIIPETVSQFTGLTDKNGKEIYEGDVIRIHEGRNDFKITLIIWNDEYLCYDPTNDELRHILRSRYSEYYEIIGNIHDNPELLNKE